MIERGERGSVKTDARKQAQNERAAVERLQNVIDANFGPDSWCLTLDYSPESQKGLTERAGQYGGRERIDAVRRAAEKEFSCLLRRIRHAMSGESPRYVAVTADLDDVTGRYAPAHHHVVADSRTAEFVAQKWKLGPVHKSPLTDVERERQAGFLLRQVRRVYEVKKYTRSRNLQEPENVC